MGKRYYCDYCNKSFADNPVNRKNHLSGVIHNQNRKAHYDALRDEEEILRDEGNKRPCRAFLSTGNCKFGDRCQYSHLTNDDRIHLVEAIEQKKKLKELRLQEKKQESTDSAITALEAWIEKRSKKRTKDAVGDDDSDNNTAPKKQASSSVTIPEYKLASCLSTSINIPPSLLPPTKGEIMNAAYAQWG